MTVAGIFFLKKKPKVWSVFCVAFIFLFWLSLFMTLYDIILNYKRRAEHQPLPGFRLAYLRNCLFPTVSIHPLHFGRLGILQVPSAKEWQLVAIMKHPFSTVAPHPLERSSEIRMAPILLAFHKPKNLTMCPGLKSQVC